MFLLPPFHPLCPHRQHAIQLARALLLPLFCHNGFAIQPLLPQFGFGSGRLDVVPGVLIDGFENDQRRNGADHAKAMTQCEKFVLVVLSANGKLGYAFGSPDRGKQHTGRGALLDQLERRRVTPVGIRQAQLRLIRKKLSMDGNAPLHGLANALHFGDSRSFHSRHRGRRRYDRGCRLRRFHSLKID